MKPRMFSYMFYAGDWSKREEILITKVWSLRGSDILAEMALRKEKKMYNNTIIIFHYVVLTTMDFPPLDNNLTGSYGCLAL